MPYIAIVIAVIAIFIGCIIIIKHRQNVEQKYYDAAYQMVKEDYLTQSILNRNMDSNYLEQKKMICIKFCNSKSKQGYVFNPEKGVQIGRDKNSNSICIPNSVVSQVHCRILSTQNQIYIQDLNSTNGFTVKRRLSKYPISNGETMFLENKDKILIGNAILEINIFDFEMLQR